MRNQEDKPRPRVVPRCLAHGAERRVMPFMESCRGKRETVLEGVNEEDTSDFNIHSVKWF